MGTNLSFLKQFEYYCIDEGTLNEEIAQNRSHANFIRVMRELEKAKSSLEIATEYANKLKQASDLVDSFSIIHNTSLENLMGILQEGWLLSREKSMLDDVSYRDWVTGIGDYEELHKYVV